MEGTTFTRTRQIELPYNTKATVGEIRRLDDILCGEFLLCKNDWKEVAIVKWAR
jgi:hypothetical protein